jgi:hypothetical protein
MKKRNGGGKLEEEGWKIKEYEKKEKEGRKRSRSALTRGIRRWEESEE